MLILVNIFFALILMPYVSPIQLGSDIQPLVGIFGFLLLLIALIEKKIFLSKFDLYFFFIAIISLIYINFNLPVEYEFRKRIGLLFAFIVYMAIKIYYKQFSYKVFKIVIWMYFISAILQILSPTIFEHTIGLVVRDIKTDMSVRGVTSLCTEPSYLSFMGIFFIFVLNYFNNKINLDLKEYRFYLILIILLILLSKAVSGFLVGISMLLFVIIKKYFNLKYFLIILVVISLFVVFIINMNFENRALRLFQLLITNPQSLLVDASFGSRFNQLSLGFLSYLVFPFGNGIGNFSLTINELYTSYDFSSFFINKASRLRVESEMNGPISVFSQYSIELGLFYLIFVLLILFKMRHASINKILFVILSMFVTFPIVFPPIWFLIALEKGKNEKNTNICR